MLTAIGIQGKFALEWIANHCSAPRAPIPSQKHWCAGRTLPYIGAQTALT